MRFDKVIPSARLQPYIREFVISENTEAQAYTVFPSTGLVIGFQYRGSLSLLGSEGERALSPSGITGISNSHQTFRSTAGTGTVLVYFTETGLAHFSSCPAQELFNQSVSLEHLFATGKVREVEEQLALAATDSHRIKVVERFLLAQLKEKMEDQVVVQAVTLIYGAKGSLKISELPRQLHISQSAFEKRFRKLVGTTPKKFASIVRFHAVLADIGTGKSLTELCYDHQFFDQAHFTRDFKQYTGISPEQYKRVR